MAIAAAALLTAAALFPQVDADSIILRLQQAVVATVAKFHGAPSWSSQEASLKKFGMRFPPPDGTGDGRSICDEFGQYSGAS